MLCQNSSSYSRVFLILSSFDLYFLQSFFKPEKRKRKLRQEQMSEVVTFPNLCGKRQNPLPAYMPGYMLVPGLDIPTACIVREVSSSGAKIAIKGHSIIPRAFWLQLEGDTRLHLCNVASITEEYVTVDFRPNQRAAWTMRRCDSSQQLPHRARL